MATALLARNIFEEYYIMSKKNVQLAIIPQNKYAPDMLIKYFGGLCPVFDAKVNAEKKKFDNKIFPRFLWWDLLELYATSCPK